MRIHVLPKFRQPAFISYSHHDSATVDAIVALLLAAHFTCWQDKRDLEPADDFDDEIKDALRRAWTVVIFVSTQSIASKWVLEEAQYALAHRKRIVIVRLDDCALPAEVTALARLQWIRLDGVRDIGQRLLSLLRKWRWQRRTAWASSLAGVFAVAAIPWLSLRAFDQKAIEIVVASELLPAHVYCDGRRMQTLTPKVPRSTLEANGRVHLIEARHGRLRAERRVTTDRSEGTFVLFLKEEFE